MKTLALAKGCCRSIATGEEAVALEPCRDPGPRRGPLGWRRSGRWLSRASRRRNRRGRRVETAAERLLEARGFAILERQPARRSPSGGTVAPVLQGAGFAAARN